MRLRIFSLLVPAIQALAPAVSHAEETPAPEAAATAPAVTLDALKAEIQKLQARHDDDLRQLRDEQALREADALVNFQQEAADRERLLRIYGFADMGAKRTTRPEDGIVASTYASPFTFFFGRMNLYFDSQPDPDFRFLTEVRLSLYPNGTPSGMSGGQLTRNSTTIYDISSTNPSSQVRWGSIIMERAVLDWKRYDLFSVRVGLFLSPFGIYNVDHGTPTLIGLVPPIYISQGWIPVQQLGLQAFGSAFVNRWELGYAATISNARTDGILDVDDSKAVGGRLLAKRKGDLKLQLGASGIYQPYRRNREQFGFSPNGLTYTTTRTVESSTLTLGADLSLDYAGLRIRSELVYYRLKYAAGKRDSPAQAMGGLSADSIASDWFLVAAYRAWKLEPFTHSEFFIVSPTRDFGDRAWLASLGLNVYLRPNVILKSAWAYIKFFADNDPGNLAARQNFHTWSALLTWAF